MRGENSSSALPELLGFRTIPHACGENPASAQIALTPNGPSPRVWGEPWIMNDLRKEHENFALLRDYSDHALAMCPRGKLSGKSLSNVPPAPAHSSIRRVT